MRLNQVTVPVRDMRAATAFYRKLGFLQIVDTPHYARFEDETGAATFSLQLAEVAENDAVLYFECEDLDQSVASLQAKGVIFQTQPEDQRWLWREASLLDPSGNKIKLYHAGEMRLNPPWRVEIKEE